MLANLISAGAAAGHSLLQAAQITSGSLSDDQAGQQIALEAIRHNPANSLVGILVPLSLFAMVVAIVWLGMRQRQARMRIKAEFHKQLLDKFGSGKEFAEFLESKGSQRFLDEMWTQRTDSRERPLRTGILLAMLGLAFTCLAWMKKDLLIPGIILLALGAGYLISVAVSYRLSKKAHSEIEASSGTAPVS
jgi:cyanate permease